MRAILFLLLTGLMVAQASGQESKKSAPSQPAETDPPRRVMVPTDNFYPQPGELAKINTPGTRGAPTRYAFSDIRKAETAADTKGLEELKARKDLFWVDEGTQVKVIKDQWEPGYQGDILEFPIEVRILDGRYKDKALYLPRASMAKMVERTVFIRLNPGDHPTARVSGTVVGATLDDLKKLSDPESFGGGGSYFKVDRSTKLVVVEEIRDQDAVRIKVQSGPRSGRVGVVPRSALRAPVPPKEPTDPPKGEVIPKD